MKTKINQGTRFLMTLAAVGVLILSTWGYPAQASAIARISAPTSTFVVNSTADLTDADQGDTICAAADGSCTLRAAIMQANYLNDADTIILPAGVYTLTRPGDDDVAVLGDLDVINDLTIQGAGSASTIIDGNGAVTNDRVFQILSSVKNFSMSGVTVRNGKRSDTFGMGGGLSWDGGGSSKFFLSDVVFDSNSAKYGGGLSLNYGLGGSVELDNVVLRSNTSTGAAGAGLLAAFSSNLSAFLMKGGKVYNNTGANQGGGLELEGTQDGTSIESIQNVEIYGNKASFGAGIDNYGGNHPYKIDLSDSYIHNNQALFAGAGINNYGLITITRTTLSSNSAVTYGGGLFNQNENSINQVQAIIDQSTFSGNTAQSGGGIYNDSTQTASALVTLTNTTLSGNVATHDGGGIYVNKGEVSIFSSTIAGNQVVVPSGDPYQGFGGGIFATSAIFLPMEDSLVAGNTHVYGLSLLVPDDCDGPVASFDYNLVQTTTNCLITNQATHNIYGMDPLLGVLAPNGGPTLTRLPGAKSPVIDAGAPSNCISAGGQPLTIDQRGFPRVVGSRCDIGAVELGPTGRGPIIFLPFIHQ